MELTKILSQLKEFKSKRHLKANLGRQVRQIDNRSPSCRKGEASSSSNTRRRSSTGNHANFVFQFGPSNARREIGPGPCSVVIAVRLGRRVQMSLYL
jgi:hypothetical protein